MSRSTVTRDSARANVSPMVEADLIRGLVLGLPVSLLFWATVLALAL